MGDALRKSFLPVLEVVEFARSRRAGAPAMSYATAVKVYERDYVQHHAQYPRSGVPFAQKALCASYTAASLSTGDADACCGWRRKVARSETNGGEATN